MGDKYTHSGTGAFEDRAMDASGRWDSDSETAARKKNRIPIVAYFHSQRRGFANSGELNDWIAAERQRDAAGDVE